MKLFTKFFNIATWVLLAYFVSQKGLGWYKEKQQQGQSLSAQSLLVRDLKSSELQLESLPEQGRRVLIFWATWCGPCEIELGRLKKIVDGHKVDAEKILAVSLFESAEEVLNVATQRNYNFPIGIDPQGKFGNQFNVRGTPTLVLIENRKIVSISTGLSLFLETTITDFLNGS